MVTCTRAFSALGPSLEKLILLSPLTRLGITPIGVTSLSNSPLDPYNLQSEGDRNSRYMPDSILTGKTIFFPSIVMEGFSNTPSKVGIALTGPIIQLTSLFAGILLYHNCSLSTLLNC